jgi:hypothetical protein
VSYLYRIASLAALSAVAIGLSGCETNPLKVRLTSCPPVAILKHTNTLTSFNSPTERNLDNVRFTAFIDDVSSTCRERDRVQTDLAFRVSAVRGQAGQAGQVTVPYFVTVMQGQRTIISKQVGAATLNFAGDSPRAETRVTAQVLTNLLPPPPPMPKATGLEGDAPRPDLDRQKIQYEVLIGFQLSDADVVYNITR